METFLVQYEVRMMQQCCYEKNLLEQLVSLYEKLVGLIRIL